MTDLIDDIIADEEVVMTEALARAFKVKGCNPACHCCYKTILAGDKFKLAEVKTFKHYINNASTTNDEMLCSDCTPDMLIASRKNSRRKHLDNKRLYPGYTRPH